MNARFENVWFTYEHFGLPAPTGQGGYPRQSRPQLQAISFEVQPGEAVGIVGRSGSGKTTLMQLFNGLLVPDQGRVLIDGQDIHSQKYDLAALRRRVGVVFQFPEMHFFAASVEEEIAYGPRQQNLSQEEIAQRITESLSLVGLGQTYRARNPFTLSQGEKRRVALAGALAMRPEMLVLDEPTASLDARGIAEVHGFLCHWHASGKNIVVISHDVDLIAVLCSRLLVLEQGRLLYDGPSASLWGIKSSDWGLEILRQSGLPLPRLQRLRRHLAQKNIAWENIPILKEQNS
ncbi:MAG: energy-coupling factor ABC transporter ATP-binding protein [candidate division KSB1 bacterium]|nr:energy-coupling factor ABC transporter ATP-binding protein [candidate division KSB1 bacterium]MDZ7300864.1 energy-coupling factor ABC transporter ATP-binding protein [candidate division KSB1 bacterium]MDZ7309866.1 energy-coupling factor ABC transporter ATP-binding protein [candidate division KSB1 bacterium]